MFSSPRAGCRHWLVHAVEQGCCLCSSVTCSLSRGIRTPPAWPAEIPQGLTFFLSRAGEMSGGMQRRCSGARREDTPKHSPSWPWHCVTRLTSLCSPWLVEEQHQAGHHDLPGCHP